MYKHFAPGGSARTAIHFCMSSTFDEMVSNKTWFSENLMFHMCLEGDFDHIQKDMCEFIEIVARNPGENVAGGHD